MSDNNGKIVRKYFKYVIPGKNGYGQALYVRGVAR